MRRLMLLRHAKTETDAPSGRDQDRRLDERGWADAAGIGGWIAHHPPFPDLVLVSAATRARQTWEISWEAMKSLVPKPHVEILPELYSAEPQHLLDIIRFAAVTDPKQLLVIGHNPGLHEVALMLAGKGDPKATKALGDNLPTSGLVLLEFEIDDWADVAFRKGRLEMFISPKVLRETSGG